MRAVLFDMDGVLVDVSFSYRLTIKKVVEHFLNRTISFSQIQDYKNRGGLNCDWDLTEKILEEHGARVKKQRIIDLFQRIYLGNNFDGLIRNEKWLLDVHILEKIMNHFKTGIVTGRPREEAIYILQRFSVQDYFSVLITRDEVPQGKAKPDPYSIKLAMKQLCANEAYYIGDNIDDMIAARRASVFAVGIISRGVEDGNQREMLLNSGAQLVLKNVDDILEVLG